MSNFGAYLDDENEDDLRSQSQAYSHTSDAQSMSRRINEVEAEILGLEGKAMGKNLIARMQHNAGDRYVEDEESCTSNVDSRSKFIEKALKLVAQTES